MGRTIDNIRSLSIIDVIIQAKKISKDNIRRFSGNGALSCKQITRELIRHNILSRKELIELLRLKKKIDTLLRAIKKGFKNLESDSQKENY